MNGLLESLTVGVAGVAKGAAFPAGRIVVIAVPLIALAFYFFVVRRNRDR